MGMRSWFETLTQPSARDRRQGEARPIIDAEVPAGRGHAELSEERAMRLHGASTEGVGYAPVCDLRWI
jgi:hypothetical protein